MELTGGSTEAVTVTQAHAESGYDVRAETVARPAGTHSLVKRHARAVLVCEVEFDGVKGQALGRR